MKTGEFFPQIGKRPRNVKEYNNQLVLSIFRGIGATTVAEVSEMTELSKTTISKIFNWMAEKEIIIPVGQGQSTAEGGKKPVVFNLNPMYCYSILISAGFADEVRCSVYNFAEKSVFESCAPLPPKVSYKEALAVIVSLVCGAIAQERVVASRVAGVAILYDGIVDYKNGVILDSVHHNWGHDLHICEDLAARLPIDNTAVVIVDNATHFSGYSETALRRDEAQNKMIITWDENRMLGWSLLSGNELVQYDKGISGAFSHIILDSAVPRVCRCGARGCLEVLLSLESIGDYIEENRDKYTGSPLLKEYDDGTFEIKNIFLEARKGDALAYALMTQIVEYFAILVRNVFNLFGVQKIVFQGMFSLSGNLFLETLYDKLLKFNLLHLFSETEINLVYSRYSYGQKEAGTDPYLKGAAMQLSNLYIEECSKRART